MKRLFFVSCVCAAAAAAPPPFSHRVHLAQKLECTFCHPAALTSTSASDNLRPNREVCLNCHENPQLPAAAPDTSPVPLVHFSHALHHRMGNVSRYIASAIDHGTYLQPADDIRRHLNTQNACDACHRGLEESDHVTAAALPQMADCLVCHTQIEPPFSCEQCHAKDAPLKPASHTERFLDEHSSGKLNFDKSTCAVCHGRNFTCMGCH